MFWKTKEKIENHYSDRTGDHLSERHVLGQLDFLHQRLIKVTIDFIRYSNSISLVFARTSSER